MKLTADRYKSNSIATLSNVSIDGERECFGLEDEYRDIKVADETRIPANEYEIILRDAGGMNNRYKSADWCKDWHVGMLWIQNVPDFQWIYIHPGNTEAHTSGCLLVGDTANEKQFTIGKSRIAYERLYKKIVAALENEPVTIEFIDNDRTA